MRLLLSALAGRAAAGLWVAEASRLRAAPWTAVPRPGRKAATRNPPTKQPTPFQSNPIQSDTGAAEYLRAHARLMQLLDLGHRLGLLSTGEWQLAVAISVVRCAMLLEQLADRLSVVGVVQRYVQLSAFTLNPCAVALPAWACSGARGRRQRALCGRHRHFHLCCVRQALPARAPTSSGGRASTGVRGGRGGSAGARCVASFRSNLGSKSGSGAQVRHYIEVQVQQ